jgi:hypothetical protein
MANEYDFLEPIPKTTVSVSLPSRGILYPKGTPMHSGKLSLSPMTMVEEAIFNNPGGDSIDRMLKRCIAETIEVNSLIGSDKFFLFLMLRAISYGPEYTFTWTCPARKTMRETCGHKNTKTVHIPDDFQMKYLADDDTEPFTVRLPETQREISFRLMRGYDEPVIERYAKGLEAQKKQGIMVENTVPAFRLARQILKVDGKDVTNAPEQKLLAFILSLPAKDVQYLRAKVSYYTPGISTDVTLVCDECGFVQEGDLPFTANFFRLSDEELEGPVGDEVRPDVLPGDEQPGDHDDGPSGTDVPPQEADRGEGVGSGVGEAQARRHAPRRVSRSDQTSSRRR